MLAALLSLACTSPPDAMIDSTDTGAGPVPDLGVMWSPRVPGPYNQLCTNYPTDERQDDNQNKVPDVQEFLDGGIPEPLFQHSAQVLQAKFADYLGPMAPDLNAVCAELYTQILFTPDYDIPVPPIGDCPNLFPVVPTDMPGNLEDYYTFGSGNLLTWAAFTNIYIFQWRLTRAMDQTENSLAPLPGCWLEFGLMGDAKTGDVNLNTMPAILFAMENYGTAAVAYTDTPQGSMVVSGADYLLPSPVWYFLNGGPTPGGVTPYHLTFLLSGYPPDASFVLNIDAMNVSVMDNVMPDTPPGALPSFTGNGIIDSESEQQLRELDWFVSQSLSPSASPTVIVDIDPSTLDLTHSAEFTATGPGPGFPKLWPN